MNRIQTHSAEQLMDWALSINPTPQGRTRAICDVVQRVLAPTAGVSLILWDQESDRFVGSASTLPGQTDGFGAQRVRSSKGATSEIITNRSHVYCPHVTMNQARENPMLAEFRIESYVGLPVIHDSRCIGAIYLLNRHPETIPACDIELLSMLANGAAHAIADFTVPDPAIDRIVPQPPAHTKASVWDAIFRDSIHGAAIIDDQGVVRSWSPTMSRLWNAQFEGPARVEDLLQGVHAESVLELINKCQSTDETEGITYIFDGLRQITTCRVIRERPDAGDRFWLSTTRIDEMLDPPAAFERLRPHRSSLGAFECLTARELEVLTLLGEGYGLHEIADLLCRARKTVDNHRTSLGTKLGRLSMPKLVSLAARSGLRPEDVAYEGESRAAS